MTLTIRAAIASATALLLPTMAAAAPLNVSVEGVEARGGTFYISVQTREQFMQNGGIDGAIVPAPEAGTLDFTFDLPADEYAVTVWHDDNANGEFDLGGQIPLDGWAMSADIGHLQREPVFDDVKITFTGDTKMISMPMVYGR